jgi:cobalt/nickel transport protein
VRCSVLKKKNILLILLCIVLMSLSFIIGSMRGGSFGGADEKIETTINQVDKNYKPWASSVWQPPSGEIESFLFALQAAIGAGFIGYYIGRKKNAKTDNGSVKNQ